MTQTFNEYLSSSKTHNIYPSFEQQAMYAFALLGEDQEAHRAVAAALEAVQVDPTTVFCEPEPVVQQPPPPPLPDLKPELIPVDEGDSDDNDEKGMQKVYKCPREHCTKVYKNRNGLKYHLQKGSCSGDLSRHYLLPYLTPQQLQQIGLDPSQIPTPNSSSPASPLINSPLRKQLIPLDDPEFIAHIKPFYCKLCSKRYKNLNGLKYHARADHKSANFHDLKGKSV
ncbi:hypothetical protein EDD86DRAFT_215441 [Gorgonomyces haynaldii]|nr:hypothetical protein EDD86DRAFT_215441 [Gorgonomyces haynaldii]